jgi:hypothetical protein
METRFHPLAGHVSITGGVMGQTGYIGQHGRSITTHHECGYPQSMWLGAAIVASNSNSNYGWACLPHHKGIMSLRCDC